MLHNLEVLKKEEALKKKEEVRELKRLLEEACGEEKKGEARLLELEVMVERSDALSLLNRHGKRMYADGVKRVGDDSIYSLACLLHEGMFRDEL